MKHQTYDLDWISSGGGPLILLPLELADRWEGADATGLAADLGKASDYAFACEAEDWIVTQVRDNFDIVIFGGEPLEAAWIPGGAKRTGTIVRWEYGDSDEDARAAADLSGDVQPLSKIASVDMGEGAILIDSAWPVREALMRLSIPISGRHSITTYRVCPHPRASFIVHHFNPDPGQCCPVK